MNSITELNEYCKEHDCHIELRRLYNPDWERLDICFRIISN